MGRGSPMVKRGGVVVEELHAAAGSGLDPVQEREK
jgi:hypothetical protein